MKYLKFAFTSLLFFSIITSCAQQDNIIGVWDVKNDYYQAVYEIEPFEGKFIGKIHYYNDGQTEYKGENKKEDYFLTDIEAKDGIYINGKMYLPDGSYYEVIFRMIDANTLEASMTVQGQLYTETWKRQSNYN
ncbi:hypothetical protein [Kordia sp.]|uniref:hypothetical protein n=1 Tax=Kordia sp. TaxID=1965332 RepID=UPI003D6B8784